MVAALVIVVLTAMVFLVIRVVADSKKKALDAENYQVCGFIKQYEMHGWRLLLGINVIVVCDVMIVVLVVAINVGKGRLFYSRKLLVGQHCMIIVKAL